MRQTDEIELRVERIVKAMSTLQIEVQRQKVLLDEMATGLSAEANKIRASIDSLDARLMPLWAGVNRYSTENQKK